MLREYCSEDKLFIYNCFGIIELKLFKILTFSLKESDFSAFECISASRMAVFEIYNLDYYLFSLYKLIDFRNLKKVLEVDFKVGVVKFFED